MQNRVTQSGDIGALTARAIHGQSRHYPCPGDAVAAGAALDLQGVDHLHLRIPGPPPGHWLADLELSFRMKRRRNGPCCMAQPLSAITGDIARPNSAAQEEINARP